MNPGNRTRRSLRGGVSRHAAPRTRWIVAGLLLLFALAQGVALSHVAGAGHDHDGACTACRLVGEHASAIAPTVSVAAAEAAPDAAAADTPLPAASLRPGCSQGPRAPPSA